MLLGLEALNASDTFEARDNLLAGLERSPRLQTFLRVRGDAITEVVFSPDGKTLAVATCKDFAVDSGCDGGDVILWDMRDPAQAKPIGKSLTDDASWFGLRWLSAPMARRWPPGAVS